MSSEIYDLTQPAHDPNIPKPRGLLPVPPWVEEAIAQDRAGMEQYSMIRHWAKNPWDLSVSASGLHEKSYVISTP
jgi:hypothetical protein